MIDDLTTRPYPALIDSLADQAVVVQVGRGEFGIRVTLVREVIRVPQITRLPSPDPSIPGLISVRGAILPLIDLSVLLRGKAADSRGMVVLVDTDEWGLVALLVEAVVDLVEIDALQDIEAEIEESLPNGWIEAVISPREDRLVTLLDLPSVLSRGPAPENSR